MLKSQYSDFLLLRPSSQRRPLVLPSQLPCLGQSQSAVWGQEHWDPDTEQEGCQALGWHCQGSWLVWSHHHDATPGPRTPAAWGTDAHYCLVLHRSHLSGYLPPTSCLRLQHRLSWDTGPGQVWTWLLFNSFFLINYFWLHWVFVAAQDLLSTCDAWASHGGGFSCCRAQFLGCAGSVAVVHGLSCSVAYGVFLDQGSNPCPLHWQVDS